ncbi:putative serine protease HtrA [Hyella patelloides LEGE 07179]|uniref:Putative serine protease HtrA n=1 Tax=Hyella patelloides LEGE 07179 TaxID=945734 RepID=A0A563VS25_9CYAN|nr:HhoA/HhoB/HtrA family serine endopeptidase [Hyella patelloides]VEP14211.1 putative serine protease HtrA [Hyella patelloides LEGE 07179]
MKKTFPSESQPQQSSTLWQKATASFSLMLLGGGIALGGHYIINSPQRIVASTPIKEITQNKRQQTSSEVAIVPQNFVTQVVNNVGPAVVRINASRTVETQIPEAFQDPLFRNFFGSQIPSMPDRQIQRGAGSGFIVSSDGLILTNAHVVDGAESVTVTLKDGRTIDGEVMGKDNLTDMAVVKIEAEDLPIVEFGDSEALQIGEWAIAIGNPLGLDNTVTTGIVSATGRNSMQIGVGDKRIDFIQTDAAINPGNSGGPLLNSQGEVIGINTAIIRNAQGLGFAIPINAARDVAEQLIANGKVEHSFLGVRMTNITPELKEQLKTQYNLEVDADRGVLIVDVLPNSPAAKAGLKQGDIISAIEEQDVSLPKEVQKIVEKTRAGENLDLAIIRQNQTIDLGVEVGVLPNS